MTTMTEIPDDAINIEAIIADLQASFDNDDFSFRDVAFDEGKDHDEEMSKWRNEMDTSWKHLVNHTMEVWDLSWNHTYDFPCKKRAEWLFRRKESPFKNCGVAECRRVVNDTASLKSGEIAQFYYYIRATLAQGSALWSYNECKDEADLDSPDG